MDLENGSEYVKLQMAAILHLSRGNCLEGSLRTIAMDVNIMGKRYPIVAIDSLDYTVCGFVFEDIDELIDNRPKLCLARYKFSGVFVIIPSSVDIKKAQNIVPQKVGILRYTPTNKIKTKTVKSIVWKGCAKSYPSRTNRKYGRVMLERQLLRHYVANLRMVSEFLLDRQGTNIDKLALKISKARHHSTLCELQQKRGFAKNRQEILEKHQSVLGSVFDWNTVRTIEVMSYPQIREVIRNSFSKGNSNVAKRAKTFLKEIEAHSIKLDSICIKCPQSKKRAPASGIEWREEASYCTKCKLIGGQAQRVSQIVAHTKKVESMGARIERRIKDIRKIGMDARIDVN